MEGTHNHLPQKSSLDTENSISNPHIPVSLPDRLSALPDSLLTDILSLIPLDAAIRTSVLSHRWTNLWTHFTRIHIDFSDLPNSDKSYSFQSFSTTVDHILSKLASHKIQSFHLNCPPLSEEDREALQCSSYLGSWVPLICGRNPEEIKVIVDKYDPDNPIVIPMCVFQCPSLLNLKLDGNFFCDVPASRTVSLPNLKEIKLRLIDMDLKSIGTVIKCCPLLERLDLAINLIRNEPILEISAPNMLYLNLEISGSCYDTKLVVDAPKLVDMRLWGLSVDYCFVTKLNGLRSASLEFRSNIIFRKRLKILEAICNVGHLRLAENLTILTPRDHGHPSVFTKFGNLTKLSMNCVSLCKLNLYETEPISACLLSKLEYIELLEFKVEKEGYKVIKFVLSHANVLEKLLINVCPGGGSFDANLSAEYRFCKEVFVLPMSCELCEIRFEGQFFKASSNDYDDDLLQCKVSYKGVGASDLNPFSDSDEEE